MGKEKSKLKSDENSVAAHQFIVEHAGRFQKHADTLKARVDELTSELSEVQEALESERAQSERAASVAKERYDRDTNELKGKLATAEDKLRRVLTTLA